MAPTRPTETTGSGRGLTVGPENTENLNDISLPGGTHV
jgi:hypothetical protein